MHVTAHPTSSPTLNLCFLGEKFNFKIITDPADLMKFVQHLKESNRKVGAASQSRVTQLSAALTCVCCLQKAQDQARSRGQKPAGERPMEKLEEEESDEDEQLLQEFEDEMSDLSVTSDKIEEIKEEMQKEFDNIINEVTDETKHNVLTQASYRGRIQTSNCFNE